MGRTCGYEEVLALEFFKRAIHNYDCKRVDSDLFGPLVRNLDNESVIFQIRDLMIPGPGEESDPDERREYARWRRRCEDEAELDRIDCLTPGDFRTVRQELYYLGDDVNNSDRLSALEEEVHAKSAGRCGKIGF